MDVTDWDACADSFDEEPDHGLRDPAVRAAWAAVLLPRLPATPARVADLGCGTGSLAVLLAAAGHHVVGVDYGPRMVARARAKSYAAGLVVGWVVGDAARPPLRPGSCDVVVVRHLLWAMRDPERALAAWFALLASGGILLLVEGSWRTGAGILAARATTLVLSHRKEAEVVVLDDPVLWGGPTGDERYLLVSCR